MNKTKKKWQLTGKTRLQKSWVWNDSVTNFVKDRVNGYSLNVCAGVNKVCTINLDLDPKDRSILKGEPLCTVLFKSKSSKKSYIGALKIINKITSIIG